MFLRARDFHVDASTQLLQKAIQWRKTTKPESIRLESVRETFDRGTMFVNGVDKANR